MPTIRLFLLGQVHTDPVPIRLLTNHILRSKQQKDPTPMVICEEYTNYCQEEIGSTPYTTFALEKRMKDLSNGIYIAEETSKLFKLFEQYKGAPPAKDLKEFIEQTRLPVNKSLSLKEQLPHLQTNSQVERLRYYMRKNLLALYKQLGKDIPYYGIELKENERSKMNIEVQEAKNKGVKAIDAWQLRWEGIRVSTMARNSLLIALKHLGVTGGDIFFPNLGAEHSHRFAAYLSDLFTKHPAFRSFQLEIYPIIFKPTISFYDQGERITLQDFCGRISEDIAKVMRAVDSPATLRYYADNPCYKLICVENQKTKGHECNEFLELLNGSTGLKNQLQKVLAQILMMDLTEKHQRTCALSKTLLHTPIIQKFIKKNSNEHSTSFSPPPLLCAESMNIIPFPQYPYPINLEEASKKWVFKLNKG